MKTPRFMTVLAATVVLTIAGCGSDDSGGDGGSSDAEKATQAKASGNVTWCIGKDTSGAFETVVDGFNKAEPEGCRSSCSNCLKTPTCSAEQQIQRLRAESTECDVLGMDVIWTAEYAASGWL